MKREAGEAWKRANQAPHLSEGGRRPLPGWLAPREAHHVSSPRLGAPRSPASLDPSQPPLPPCRLWGGLPPRCPYRRALHRGGQEAAAGGRAGE